MDNLQNTSAEGTQTSTEGTQKSGKIFTQEDVNRIVQERLAKEKNKASGNEELDQRTAELDKRAADLEAKENRLIHWRYCEARVILMNWRMLSDAAIRKN